MTNTYRVPCTSISTEILARVPGSKSLTNRALIASALCGDTTTLNGALSSEDTELASKALEQLGIRLDKHEDLWTVSKDPNIKSQGDLNLYLGNAGTATRFLTGVLCSKGVACSIDGSDRMRERPIGPLINALKELGGDITSLKNNDCPPLRIGPGGIHGGEVTLSGKISSQFFSALMFAAPMADSEVLIRVCDEWLSRPYVEMTQQLLADFGIEMELGEREIRIPAPQPYLSPKNYHIEPDASAATYPLALAVLHGVSIILEGLGSKSLQGDVAFVDHLAEMGCQVSKHTEHIEVDAPSELQALNANLADIPDAAMTLVVLCCMANGRSTLTGLSNLKFKECDRLSALEAELQKLGCDIQANDDGFVINGPAQLKGASIETYKDHRMAMCTSLLGTLVEGIEIIDPACVEKTYPNYWKDLNTWLSIDP